MVRNISVDWDEQAKPMSLVGGVFNAATLFSWIYRIFLQKIKSELCQKLYKPNKKLLCS